jgi:hypothetical protein
VDDTNLLIIARDESVLQHKVNVVMKKLQYWFQKNNLMINFVKTVAMPFHTKHSRFPVRPKIMFRNMYVAFESESKFLGIPITEYFKWNAHVCSLSLKLS